ELIEMNGKSYRLRQPGARSKAESNTAKAPSGSETASAESNAAKAPPGSAAKRLGSNAAKAPPGSEAEAGVAPRGDPCRRFRRIVRRPGGLIAAPLDPLLASLCSALGGRLLLLR